MITKTQHCILIWIGFNITKNDNYNIFHPNCRIFIHLKMNYALRILGKIYNLIQFQFLNLDLFFSSFTRIGNKKDHFSFLIYHLRSAINFLVYKFVSFHLSVNNPSSLLPDSWDWFMYCCDRDKWWLEVF